MVKLSKTNAKTQALKQEIERLKNLVEHTQACLKSYQERLEEARKNLDLALSKECQSEQK